MAIGRVDYKKSTNLEPVASAITSMGQSASKKDKPNVLGQKIKAISTDATGVEAEMLAGKTFYAAGQKKIGTMPNMGAANATLNAGGSYVIPQGYHNGSGKVTANSLASQTPATATAAQILSGQTAWVNGNKITGNMPSKGAQTYTPNTVNQTIGAGQYLSGTQTIAGDANLVPGNIRKGKKIFGVTGTFEGLTDAYYLFYNGNLVNNFSIATAQLGKITYIGNAYIASDKTIMLNGEINNADKAVRFTTPIDVTGYSTFNIDLTGTYSAEQYVTFGLFPVGSVEDAQYIAEGIFSVLASAYMHVGGTTLGNYVLNTANISGKYYLGILNRKIGSSITTSIKINSMFLR
ncbi:MAG: hypothetical protein KH355_03015 [Clostridiales bacterium]|nr:hypothetical protein [Clostridiales bacterium]